MTRPPRQPDWAAITTYGDAELAALARDLRVVGLPPAAPAWSRVGTTGALVGVSATTALAAGAGRPALACLLGAAALLLVAWLLELGLHRARARQQRDEAERALAARHARAAEAARACRALGLPASLEDVEEVRAALAERVLTALPAPRKEAAPAPAALAS
jgi:hypothetical protein